MGLSKLIIAATIVGLMASAANAADTVRVGTEGAYPPFNQIDENGKLIGFDIDIAKALCEKMQVECEFVTQDWDGIIPGLLAKKYDAIIASMSITEERKKAVSFTDRYYSNKLRFVAKDGSDFSPANLDGRVIGAQRATISASYIEDHLKDKVDYKLYDTQENAFLDLGTGRTDAVLADMLVAYDWLKSDEGKGFAFVGDAVKIDDEIGIAIRKDDAELVAKFNEALKAIIADGTYDKINAQYFPFSIY